MPKSKKNQLFGSPGLIGAVSLGIVLKMIFSGSIIAGARGSCESLGEGLMYLTAMMY